MQDGIIAGNGNSRYLKTVSTALGLYPTYEDFMGALIAGTFPIDLNGINAGGWTQQGTPLNKASLFSDSTAGALGLSASNTPNDALVKIKTLIDNLGVVINSRNSIEVGQVIGSQTTTITFNYVPSIVLVLLKLPSGAPGYSSLLALTPEIQSDTNLFYLYSKTPSYFYVSKVTWLNGNKTVSFTDNGGNLYGTLTYVAIHK